MTASTNPLSPQASPGVVAAKSGVRRVNNVPVYIVIGVMAAFLGVMVVVASDRAAQQSHPAEKAPEKNGDTSLFATEIVGSQKDGIIAAKLPVPELTTLSTSANAAVSDSSIAAPENTNPPPEPPHSADSGTNANTERENNLSRIHQAKMQLLEDAIKARTTVQMTAARSPTSPDHAPGSREETLAKLAAVRQQLSAAAHEDPTAAYKARLAQVQGAGLSSGSSGEGSTAPQTASSKNQLAPFTSSGPGDRWKLDTQTEAPRSPFELRAGFVMPATLISGIHSELPGQIVAQVAQNVYDTPTGKHLLIAQGSRLIGSYSSEIAFGQARLFVAWQRLVFPDGKALDIGAMPGADSAGYAGLNDQVNNHYLRLFGSAILMSGVTAGIAQSQRQGGSNNSTPSASNALSEALGQQLGQVTAQLIAKNMGVAPSLEIRPGYRFNVIVTKDLTFAKPYESFDY
jgi:type IV secretion system protein TrbI